MVITKTPFRMSFFGGGTDMESFFREYGGAVLSATFDKYCYVTVRRLPRFFEYRSHLTYSQNETVNRYDEISHPAIRNAMRMLDMHELRLIYDADLPARSGLGTSSSFAVGMLNAFHVLKGTPAGRKQLADEAIYLERTLCREAGGWQDQIAAAYGGLNRICFHADGYEVVPVNITPERKRSLNDHLLLFFTGFVRYSSEVQKANAETGENRTARLREIFALTDRAQRVLEDPGADLDEFGVLLDRAWRLKRGMGRMVSTTEIDELYRTGIRAGALGGKLLGAGGGGFLLFYVRPEQKQAVRDALRGLLYIPFRFEDGGSRVIYHSPADNGTQTAPAVPADGGTTVPDVFPKEDEQ